MLRPAIYNAPHTQEFCYGVAANKTPIEVFCSPVSNQPVNECFSVVEQYIATHGGESIIGWAIWERSGVFIEAEFHAVWRSDGGEYLDVAPRIQPFNKITFLPDPNKKYIGLQVDNVRKAIAKDNDVVRFLFLFKRQFEILNTGDLATQYGEISLPPRLYKEYAKLAREQGKLERRLEKRYPCHAKPA